MPRIEVDQSGKIEDTRVKTIVAYSNDTSYAIEIPATVKRETLQILRQRYKESRALYLKIFSVALYLLLKNILDRAQDIVIDVEYQGKEEIIKGLLLERIRRIKPDFDKHLIRFARIGKKSTAHRKAYRVYVGREKPDRMIHATDLLELL